MIEDDKLRYYLNRFREIAPLPDDQAIEETAGLLQEFYEGTWSLESARAELERLRREAEGTLETIRRGASLNQWKAQELRRTGDELGTRWPQPLKGQFAGDVNEVRNFVYHAADETEIASALSTIAGCATEPLINAQQILRVFRDLTEAHKVLTRHGRLTPAAQGRLREANERAAWYRARKKLDEGEVAAVGGNVRKATKLRAEAAVQLKQDWAVAFPGEQPPSTVS